MNLRHLFLTMLFISASLSAYAQACTCVCMGATNLPDPLPVSTATNLPECQTACSDLMYANALFFLNCSCTGAPLAPDPSDPVESASEADCTSACAALGYSSSNCTLLPVELVFFEGERINKEAVFLRWQTASEIDNAGFEVERSENGLLWQSLDFVKGNGTSVSTHDYKWKDEDPLQSVAYYRLKQIDDDGNFEYSPIISVDMHSSKLPSLLTWPNPAGNYLTFQLVDSQDYRTEPIYLYNYFGVLLGILEVQEFDLHRNQGSIYVGNLPKGLYIMSIQFERMRINRSFVKA